MPTVETLINTLSKMPKDQEVAYDLWVPGDVQSLAADKGYTLTDEQAEEIISSVERRKDACYGISWDTIDYHLSEYISEHGIEEDPEPEEEDGPNMNLEHNDFVLVMKVAKRAADALGSLPPLQDIELALTACHLNDVPLDFERMLTADMDDVSHDIYGILKHIDPKTGQLGSGFLPRLTLSED